MLLKPRPQPTPNCRQCRIRKARLITAKDQAGKVYGKTIVFCSQRCAAAWALINWDLRGETEWCPWCKCWCEDKSYHKPELHPLDQRRELESEY